MKTPLVILTKDDAPAKGSELVPLFDRQLVLPADPSICVLLGWSSTGAGMQSVHAWVVRAPAQAPPVVIDKVSWTTDRGSAGLIVDTSKGIAIGIPWTFDGSMHSSDEWSLRHGTAAAQTLDAVMKRRFDVSTAPFLSYRPPFDRDAWAVGTRVSWMVAGPTGLRAVR